MRIADFEYASDVIFNLQCEIPKAHEEAEDAGRIPHGLELLPGVLSQAPPGGHRPTRTAEGLRVPTRREATGAAHLLEQVRKRHVLPESTGYPCNGSEERLAALRGRGAGDLRGRTASAPE